MQVNMQEAETDLIRLIELLETNKEDEILIDRNGEPVAKITKYEKPINKRIGIAAGKHKPLDLDLFNSLNDEITREFYGE